MTEQTEGKTAAACRMAKYLFGLTDEMVKDYKEAFIMYCKDEDEGITIMELCQVMEVLGQSISESELQKLIDDVGSCRDGRVDFGQFLQMMSIKLETTGGQDLKEAFQVFDKTNKGYLTADELRNVMLSLGEKLTSEEVDDMIKEGTSGKDEIINYEGLIILSDSTSEKRSL